METVRFDKLGDISLRGFIELFLGRDVFGFLIETQLRVENGHKRGKTGWLSFGRLSADYRPVVDKKLEDNEQSDMCR